MTHLLRVAVVAVGLVAFAADASADVGTPFASSYWNNFLEYWKGTALKQNAMVLGTLLLMLVCIFILTRSKAKK